jgi:hypothetical protein
MMAGMITLILTGLLRGVRTQRSLVFENLALRHQLAVLQRTARRPRLRTADRLLWVLLSRMCSGWMEVTREPRASLDGGALRKDRDRDRRWMIERLDSEMSEVRKGLATQLIRDRADSTTVGYAYARDSVPRLSDRTRSLAVSS